MSGGGGDYFPSDLKTIKERLKNAETGTGGSEYEAEVARFLSDQLSRYNDRDVEKAGKHLDQIKKAIEKDIEGTIDLLYGGSVKKHTYVDGLSDVDSLVVLNKSELANGSPEDARAYLERRLKERFPKHEISSGTLAVTIKFDGIELQLLPAISKNGRMQISSKDGRSWAPIHPDRFTGKLTEVNKSNQQKVIPTIKLAKGIIGQLPEKHRVSGYHAESLAIEAFRNYKGEYSRQALLEHFFRHASQSVKNPIRDSAGQSVHVDEYLGSANSLERRIVSDAFSRIARRMSNAKSASSVGEWKDLFGE